MKPIPADGAAISEAAKTLRGGGIVAFPTETVYGLGADATRGEAVARVYEIKGRPSFNPLIVHIGETQWLTDLALSNERMDVLAETFWPGPLTVVLKRRPDCPVSELASAGLDTIAVRRPDHPTAHALLMETNRPLAAPSANPSGRVSPTTAEHVARDLADKVDLILDGGPCAVGLESTVLDLTGTQPVILRPGVITAADLEPVIGPVLFSDGDSGAPKSPGQMARHYAPGLPLRLNAADARPGEALLGFGPAENAAFNLSPKGDLREAAANLFAGLRALDDPARFSGIAAMSVPAEGLGLAINDRLKRAAEMNAK